MKKTSAGLLMYRLKDGELEVFLAHPGGPFYVRKDEGFWTIPKGEVNENEELLAAAQREFEEETGVVPEVEFIPLGSVRQKSGKIVHAWAFEGKKEPHILPKSNFFEMEWPPHSGKTGRFPEIDKAEFFGAKKAREKIHPAQAEFIERLEEKIGLKKAVQEKTGES
ncbi:MAG: NUDIX domain-containing protein [Candidatus Diapherotrites archaeon]|nr:NUDIX domain-containing protein [Candidatus Diapherotrites archaeon]